MDSGRRSVAKSEKKQRWNVEMKVMVYIRRRNGNGGRVKRRRNSVGVRRCGQRVFNRGCRGIVKFLMYVVLIDEIVCFRIFVRSISWFCPGRVVDLMFVPDATGSS